MSDPQDRLTALEAEVAALQARLAAVEGQLSSVAVGSAPGALFRARRSPQSDHVAGQTEPVEGTLSYSGTIQRGERPVRFRQTLSVQSLMEAPPDLLAPIFAALASPHRLILLRTLCERTCTAQQLQEVLGMGSAGQLYHHLKELLAAGLITQRERSSAYTIAPEKVIPIYAALMVAFSLATFPLGTMPGTPPPPDPDEDLP